MHKDAMETNLRSLNLSSQRAAAHFAYAVWTVYSEYFQPLEAAPSAAISRKWAESAILSDLLYLLIFSPLVSSPVGGVVYANVIPQGMKWKYASRRPRPFPYPSSLPSPPALSFTHPFSFAYAFPCRSLSSHCPIPSQKSSYDSTGRIHR